MAWVECRGSNRLSKAGIGQCSRPFRGTR
uniref:Uncharacterized protein n=1 Tax=Anguilla anguilla TaxID=7936 RepID=A0A0E9U4P3_ANGAN